jgi:hypothetical protein
MIRLPSRFRMTSSCFRQHSDAISRWHQSGLKTGGRHSAVAWLDPLLPNTPPKIWGSWPPCNPRLAPMRSIIGKQQCCLNAAKVEMSVRWPTGSCSNNKYRWLSIYSLRTRRVYRHRLNTTFSTNSLGRHCNTNNRQNCIDSIHSLRQSVKFVLTDALPSNICHRVSASRSRVLRFIRAIESRI